MRMWWLRHGPTHEKAFLGWRNVPADLGNTAQLDRLRSALPPIATIISSDLLRARQTADAVTGSRTRLPDHPGLREFNFGAWDGLGFDAVADRDPELSRAFWDSPGDIAPPEGESWNAVAKRVGGVVGHLAKKHQGTDVIAVAHIGVIMTQIAACMGEDAASAIARQIEPLSLTRIDLVAGTARLLSVNQIP